MDLKSDRELVNTKAKLLLLERSSEEARTDPSENEYVRKVTLESLARLIKQLKEEIARYEARHAVRQ
jgi:hypothetical protein